MLFIAHSPCAIFFMKLYPFWNYMKLYEIMKLYCFCNTLYLKVLPSSFCLLISCHNLLYLMFFNCCMLYSRHMTLEVRVLCLQILLSIAISGAGSCHFSHSISYNYFLHHENVYQLSGRFSHSLPISNVLYIPLDQW